MHASFHFTIQKINQHTHITVTCVTETHVLICVRINIQANNRQTSDYSKHDKLPEVLTEPDLAPHANLADQKLCTAEMGKTFFSQQCHYYQQQTLTLLPQQNNFLIILVPVFRHFYCFNNYYYETGNTRSCT